MRKSLDAFVEDARSASPIELRRMREWPAYREIQSDRPDVGVRNPRARRNFRRMKAAADEELERRDPS